MKVLVAHDHPFELWRAPAWLGKRIESDFPQLKIVQLPDYHRVSQEIGDTEIFVGFVLNPAHFAAAKKLRWIHSPATAVHQLMYPELINSSVAVTNAREVHGPVVAEHAIALVLALAKRLPRAMQYQVKREWAQQKLWDETPRPREVADATVVVIGMGGIGREFTSRAKALGIKVVAVRENPEKGTDGADTVLSLGQLDEALPQADFVVLCVPVTAATTGLINEARLAKMHSGAYLINVGRGQLIDEAALLQALRDRRIGGAALDVFTEEPLPAHSLFWSLDNVLITPHTAAVTERLWDRHYKLLSENLTRFLAGQPLLYEVDKKRGY
jgi:phosphoglycerate dehydrogenase-like enzyme